MLQNEGCGGFGGECERVISFCAASARDMQACVISFKP